MKSTRLAAAMLVLSASSLLPLPASTAEPAAPPAAARFYPFVGHWKGQGEMAESGQPPVKLALDYRCKRASAGSAVSCEMKASNDKMAVAETDLFGVDPVSGQGHWYAVSNQGETHDHLADWTDANNMKARYAWTQDGKKMEEHVTMKFNGSNTLEFRSIMRVEGQQVASFHGTLKR